MSEARSGSGPCEAEVAGIGMPCKKEKPPNPRGLEDFFVRLHTTVCAARIIYLNCYNSVKSSADEARL